MNKVASTAVLTKLVIHVIAHSSAGLKVDHALADSE